MMCIMEFINFDKFYVNSIIINFYGIIFSRIICNYEAVVIL